MGGMAGGAAGSAARERALCKQRVAKRRAAAPRLEVAAWVVIEFLPSVQIYDERPALGSTIRLVNPKGDRYPSNLPRSVCTTSELSRVAFATVFSRAGE
jgi:hypothetical protein